MIEKNVIEKWCPYSRVVLQQHKIKDVEPAVGVLLHRPQQNKNSIETVTVSYNRTSMTMLPGDDEMLSKSAICIGSNCAKWAPSSWNILCYVPFLGYFWPKCGRCG